MPCVVLFQAGHRVVNFVRSAGLADQVLWPSRTWTGMDLWFFQYSVVPSLPSCTFHAGPRSRAWSLDSAHLGSHRMSLLIHCPIVPIGRYCCESIYGKDYPIMTPNHHTDCYLFARRPRDPNCLRSCLPNHSCCNIYSKSANFKSQFNDHIELLFHNSFLNSLGRLFELSRLWIVHVTGYEFFACQIVHRQFCLPNLVRRKTNRMKVWGKSNGTRVVHWCCREYFGFSIFIRWWRWFVLLFWDNGLPQAVCLKLSLFHRRREGAFHFSANWFLLITFELKDFIQGFWWFAILAVHTADIGTDLVELWVVADHSLRGMLSRLEVRTVVGNRSRVNSLHFLLCWVMAFAAHVGLSRLIVGHYWLRMVKRAGK